MMELLAWDAEPTQRSKETTEGKQVQHDSSRSIVTLRKQQGSHPNDYQDLLEQSFKLHQYTLPILTNSYKLILLGRLRSTYS